MSLDKAIEHGKEKRKPFYRSGKYDKTCRCHGSCPWCLSNRLHAVNVADEKLEQDLQEICYEE